MMKIPRLEMQACVFKAPPLAGRAVDPSREVYVTLNPRGI